ncbi:hypothetical protein MKW92_043502, partial [Papaver armeniacum]
YLQALFFQPNLLLLDDPTNHLDLRVVLWLEEYLCRWKKTLFVLQLYRGNFDEFERGYEQRRNEMNKNIEIFDKQVKKEKERVKFNAMKESKRKGKGKVDEDEPMASPQKNGETTV